MARILVVNDESHIRDVVCFALKKTCDSTIEAIDGHAAISAFEQDQPDLIILDIVMPGMDGTDVCREIRKATEFAMLRTLIKQSGQVYRRDSLMQHACELRRVVSDRTIDSHVRRLRKKLLDAGADAIETVHGVGFRLRKEST